MYQNTSNSELLYIDTVIAKTEDKGDQIKIEDNNKDFFSFFKKKKDGTASAAYSTFQQFKVGDTVTIVYKNVPYKGNTLRSIVKFKPFQGRNPSRAAATASTSAPQSEHEVVAKWAQANHPTTWAKIVEAYNAANPKTINTLDEINVEDIPF